MKLNQLNSDKLLVKIRRFFHSQKWKNCLVFFSFVILACCFWIIQYFGQKFDFELVVPIHYTELPPEIALSSELPRQIHLNLQDKGTVWLNYKVNKFYLSIDINLKDIRLDNKSPYILDKSILYNLIYDQLSTTTQLKSFSPETIVISYSPLVDKKLPVSINGTLSPASGFMFSDPIHIDPPFVTAYGDKKSLDTLTNIQTHLLNKSNIDKKLAISAKLISPANIRLSTTQVRLEANVEEYTEKSFELPIHCYNVPGNRTIRFFPSTVELFVQVGLSKYRSLTESDLEIGIDYNDLTQSTSMNCSPTLTKKPHWLINYRIEPDVVEFLMEQKQIFDEILRQNFH